MTILEFISLIPEGYAIEIKYTGNKNFSFIIRSDFRFVGFSMSLELLNDIPDKLLKELIECEIKKLSPP